MTVVNSVLSKYQALVEEHTSQFRPQVDTLRQLIDERMKEIHEAEDKILEAESVEIKKIIHALETDARFLLSTSEFKEFVRNLQHTSKSSSYSLPKALVVKDPTTWLLTEVELPIYLTEYKNVSDPYAYDDERTYNLYTHCISLSIGDEKCSLAIEYKRIYGYDEVRKYSWEGMISQCTYEASDLTFGLNSNSGNKKRIKTLIEEVSILVVYSILLFTLKPTISMLEYHSLPPEKYLSWFMEPEICEP